MSDDDYKEFCEKAGQATREETGLKFQRYIDNLSYNSEGIFSYGYKIAKLDLSRRTIQKLGYFSQTSSKHYNYAKRILEESYGFSEKENAPASAPLEFLCIQHLSYDDHT